MADLKMITKTTHYINYSDLEQFIQDTYGFTYEIVAAEETGNDTSLTFEIEGAVDSDEMEEFNRMVNGEWLPYRTRLILEMMAAQHKIYPGSYVIHISW